MLNSRTALLDELIVEATQHVGLSPKAIADHVLPMAFPRSLPELEAEGGDKLLRAGLIQHVKRIIDRPAAIEQRDLSEVDPTFGAIIARLPKRMFFVPSLDEFVWIGDLVKEPERLNEARQFTRQKGDETLATAALLDQLYAAVVGEAA